MPLAIPRSPFSKLSHASIPCRRQKSRGLASYCISCPLDLGVSGQQNPQASTANIPKAERSHKVVAAANTLPPLGSYSPHCCNNEQNALGIVHPEINLRSLLPCTFYVIPIPCFWSYARDHAPPPPDSKSTASEILDLHMLC